MNDQETKTVSDEQLLQETSRIVAAYVAKHPLPSGLLNELIQSVHQALASLSEGGTPAVDQQPAVPVKKSVTPDYIICLEDGKKLKMLKRHLRTNFNMTPDQYRTKWGLANDYPMIAPNYAKMRSAFAKKIGLGRRPAAEAVAAPKARKGARR